jgi:hypothetical protein
MAFWQQAMSFKFIPNSMAIEMSPMQMGRLNKSDSAGYAFCVLSESIGPKRWSSLRPMKDKPSSQGFGAGTGKEVRWQ